MPKVSVIIPVYNVEKYLSRCLDSVCDQTLSDIEIICVNDCSPDNSIDILKQYAKNDNRIKIIDFKQNQGVSVARNTGIDNATGEYIAFVDPDDYIDLDFYEKLYNESFEQNFDAIKGKLSRLDSTGKYNVNITDDYTHDMIKQNNAYFHKMYTTAIYKTSFIKKNKIYFPINTPRLEDHFFSIMAVLFYKSIKTIDTVNYYYVNNNQSATKNTSDNNVILSINCLLEILSLLNNSGIASEKYKIIYNHLVKTANSFLKNDLVSENAKNHITDTLDKLISGCLYTQECQEFKTLEDKKISAIALKKQQEITIKHIRKIQYESNNKRKNLTAENSNKILALKNKHQGERCFIVGGSPSLNQLDLTKLNNEYTFTVNRGYKLAENGLKKSNYHVMSDVYTFIDDKINDEIPQNFAQDFLIYGGIDFSIQEKATYFDFKLKKDDFNFQKDITLPLQGTQTIIYYAYQLAYYMGFNEIYLIGVDLDFKNNTGHAYVETNGEKTRQREHTVSSAPIMLETIKYCSDFLKQQGVKCYNASPAGNINFMQRVNYKELFND